MKISVIVPVYNAEKYIKKCIMSVLHQTYSDWELILIDDGSTDKSADIIDKAAKKDSRLKVIHKINEGPGIARNSGIKEAVGEYVVFLDSDDFIDRDYFQLLAAKAGDNDIVFIDVDQLSPEGKMIKREKMSAYKYWGKNRLIRSQMTGKILWGGVRKAVRLSLLRDNNIRFTSHVMGEEALYSFRILYAAERIDFIDEKPVYFYVNHAYSQSKIQMIDPWGQVVKNMKEYLEEAGLYREFADSFNAFNLTATVVSLDRIAQMYKGKERKKYAEDRILQFQSLNDTSKGIDYHNMSYKAKFFIPFLLKEIYLPVMICSRIKKVI